MSREQFDQRLIEECERELRDALAIEPSPDFARQVRARIAARPAPVVWWRFALPIAATCVMAVGFTVWMNREKEKDVRLTPEATVKAAVAPQGSNEDTSKVDTSKANTSLVGSGFSRTLTTTSPQSTPAPEPEIIVPPDRALALARLLELTRNGSLNEETLKPVAAARPPAELEIKPLVVAPILIPELETPSGTAQGGADRE